MLFDLLTIVEHWKGSKEEYGSATPFRALKKHTCDVHLNAALFRFRIDMVDMVGVH
jgi:hypothetical protein